LEQNALQEVQRNILADKELRSSPMITTNITEITTTEVKKPNNDTEMYVPSRSSWGVFERPRDISKAYGGGRVITREEVARKNREYELEQLRAEKQVYTALSDANKLEQENKERLQVALNKGRRFLQFGDRFGAVKVLEGVQQYANIQSELGGEVLLELGMALETVNRTDDARKMYGRLLTQSSNSKVRRNALGLLQGLELVSKLRKDIVSDKNPLLDMESMSSISAAFREGLRNDWDDYKKKGTMTTIAIYILDIL
jgi:hypothetical protein